MEFHITCDIMPLKLEGGDIMRACEVMKLLRISRQTLSNYTKKGLIRTTTLVNGRYDYNTDDVYKLLNNDVERKTCIYARVSTVKQKKDLENQVDILKQFCFMNGYKINEVYTDVASGISFEKRKDFFKLLDEIIDHRVERVVITYKDRLSRVGFDLFYHLFHKYDCEIIVMSQVGSQKLDREEVFEEIISLLHCYSMKLDSKRIVQKMKEALEDESTES